MNTSRRSRGEGSPHRTPSGCGVYPSVSDNAINAPPTRDTPVEAPQACEPVAGPSKNAPAVTQASTSKSKDDNSQKSKQYAFSVFDPPSSILKKIKGRGMEKEASEPAVPENSFKWKGKENMASMPKPTVPEKSESKDDTSYGWIRIKSKPRIRNPAAKERVAKTGPSTVKPAASTSKSTAPVDYEFEDVPLDDGLEGWDYIQPAGEVRAENADDDEESEWTVVGRSK